MCVCRANEIFTLASMYWYTSEKRRLHTHVVWRGEREREREATRRGLP